MINRRIVSNIGALVALSTLATQMTEVETAKARKAAEPRNVNPDKISGLPRSRKGKRNIIGKP